MFENILVCVDGSASSRRALDYAIELARPGGANLTLIAVSPPVTSYVTLAGVTGDEMQTELDAWASGLLRKAHALVPEGVGGRQVQRRGDAGPAIVRELEDGDYDLVILGSRGRGRAQSTLLGSVTATSTSTRAYRSSRSRTMARCWPSTDALVLLRRLIGTLR